MASFRQTMIQDVDHLLAMQPEELGEYVLKYVASYALNGQGKVHGQELQNWAEGQAHDPNSGYELPRRAQALEALSEALAWLLNAGLMVPQPGFNGSNGWVQISRLGRNMLADDGFARHLQAMKFPASLLHPSVASSVYGDLLRGEWGTAIFKSFKAVEEAVRAAGGFGAGDIGVKLMRAAFHPQTGPLTDLTQEEGERQALSDLFAGAIGSYKNAHSHRTVTIGDPVEAYEQVLLGSHLLRIVDARAAVA